MSKTMKWVIAVAVVIFSYGVGAAGCEDCEKEVVTETVTKEVCTQTETWKELKRTDDQIMKLDARAEGKCADILTDISNGNFANLGSDSRWIARKVDEKENLMKTRSSLLGKLGY